jgi:hypothetical protein
MSSSSVSSRAQAVLELSRFAYKTTPSSSRTPDPGPSRPAALPSQDPPDHLPDPQLSRLSKCIGCGLEWTSRKTAKQKRAHIKQCAKKNALTNDTVRILIQKEIAIVSPSQNTAASPSETTLMDSVVPTAPVKKSKRQQVLPTVRSLPETRDGILGRARDILGPTNDQADPHSTQQFCQSALACRNTRHPQRPALLDVSESAEEPPSTQPFRASSLHGVITTAERSVDGREESSLQFGASLFAQDSVLSSDHVSVYIYLTLSVELMSSSQHKRPASPPPLVGSNSRTVRRRLL